MSFQLILAHIYHSQKYYGARTVTYTQYICTQLIVGNSGKRITSINSASGSKGQVPNGISSLNDRISNGLFGTKQMIGELLITAREFILYRVISSSSSSLSSDNSGVPPMAKYIY
eukprot:1123583_1